MKKIYSTKKIFSLITAILFATAIFFGCNKNDINGADNNPTPPDLTTKVSSSVSGFVTDENDLAVNLATVQVGTVTVTTDKYGYFEARNVNVVKDAATVTVTRSGYFKGIKTYIAEEGRSAFFRIKLIPKTIVGTVSGTAGGIVTLTNGLSITLPANAVVNASSGAAYTGTVNVSAKWINPTSIDLPNIMPGDLRGINTAGNLQLLTTYGMTAVELTGTGGEILQMAVGKKATLSLPIPSSLMSTAPATIPLWYFDETKGLWKEEGIATKTGNNYVSDVSHFSFWNCDVPNNYVQFNCTVKNSAGQPIPNAFVKISVVTNPANNRSGYTDSAGYVSGAVPDNTQLLLEIFSSYSCTTPSYSQTFTTTNVNVSLGTITISNTSAIATITGTVTNCNNMPVTNGNLILQNGNVFRRYTITNGTYNFNLLLCGNTNNTVTLFAEDLTAFQQSIPVSYTVAPGNNALPNIQVCGNTIQQFVVFTSNGITRSYIFPTDFVEHQLDTAYTPFLCDAVSGLEIGQNIFTRIFFLHSNIALGSSQELKLFLTLWTGGDNLTILNPPIQVNITEYGSIGQFISGNFSGTFRGDPPNNTIYNIVCHFRVKRYQ